MGSFPLLWDVVVSDREVEEVGDVSDCSGS